jgi:hypothetical protein
MEEAWRKVAHECPRRIIGELHRDGVYRHGTSARYPDKVLCLHYETPPPVGWQPTPAQVEAWEESLESVV